MATSLSELARANTALEGDALEHVQRLVGSWQPLSDLSFSDLLLFAPEGTDAGVAARFVVLAHVRPTTGQTLYPDDLVGTAVRERERGVVGRAWHEGRITNEETAVLGSREPARVECIPVRCHDEVVAVLSRESSTTLGRRTGELERQYLDVFEQFAAMVSRGEFPFARDKVEHEEAPRVADGVIVLDENLRVRFTSPNAMSSLHRMGIYASTQGLRLSEVGFDEDPAEVATRVRLPVLEEIERAETSLLVQATPLLEGERLHGVLMLVRDVTDLRRRDRILVSKDATIREIHHRVKNNLQTIAALLRLQGRRVESPEAQEAIEESERRIRSIAIVHETLSRDVRDTVDFAEILHPLVRVVEDTVTSDELRLRFDVEGDAGELPGDVVTPLAVVLTELMQNAVDHAFPHRDGRVSEGRVCVRVARHDDVLLVEVADDGVGLPAGFSLDGARGLGLSIVQSLVTSELGGSIEFDDAEPGTRVRLRVPLQRPQPAEL